MKVFSRFSLRSRVIVGTVLSLVAVATFAVPAVTHADLEGASRPSKPYVQGMAGFDHVQFDSFTGVPNIGDERQFFTGKNSTSTGNMYDGVSNVQAGDEMTLRVYIHNNADSSLNASGTGVAKNTRVAVTLPTGLATNQTALASISADNAQPQTIQDDFTLSGATPFGMQFVPGSATLQTNYQNVPLSDNLVSGGVQVGSNDLGGNWNGCFDFVGYVIFKVKVTTPNYNMQKQVRLDGTTTWNKQVTAKPGDKVNFELTFNNTGSTQLNNVIFGDRMPVGLTYVPGTSQYKTMISNGWQTIAQDNWIGNGYNMGNYAAGSTSYLRFTAKVDDESKLQCGLNRITNVGFIKPEGQQTIQESAEVDVTRTCATATPVYSCDLFDITTDKASRTVTVSTFKTTATSGAIFKSVDINWGETGVNVLNTDTAVGKAHTYKVESGNDFTITATAHMATPTSNDVTATSALCAKKVSFTTPAATAASTSQAPAQLVNTGSGNLFGLFAAVTVIGAVAHRLFSGRKLAR